MKLRKTTMKAKNLFMILQSLQFNNFFRTGVQVKSDLSLGNGNILSYPVKIRGEAQALINNTSLLMRNIALTSFWALFSLWDVDPIVPFSLNRTADRELMNMQYPQTSTHQT